MLDHDTASDNHTLHSNSDPVYNSCLAWLVTMLLMLIGRWVLGALSPVRAVGFGDLILFPTTFTVVLGIREALSQMQAGRFRSMSLLHQVEPSKRWWAILILGGIVWGFWIVLEGLSLLNAPRALTDPVFLLNVYALLGLSFGHRQVAQWFLYIVNRIAR